MPNTWTEPVWAAPFVALLVACAPADSAAPPPSASPPRPTEQIVADPVGGGAGGPAEVGTLRDLEGTVLSNNRGCRVDSYCVLSLRTVTGEVSRVTYGTPRGVPCANAIELGAAQDLEPGHRVRVRAMVTEGGDLDACATGEGLVEPAP